MVDDGSKLTVYLLGGLALGLLLGGFIGYYYSKSVSINQDEGITTASVDKVVETGGGFELEVSINNKGLTQPATIYISKDMIKKLGIQPPPTQAQPTKTQAPQTPPPPPTKDVVRSEAIDDDPSAGNPDATVVVVEFSDFQCPFCERAAPTVRQIKETYGDQILFVYRDFPLSSIHPDAQKAAEAAQCAHEQGRFWEYHDTLFENRLSWSGTGTPKFKEYAADLGLDTTAFDQCLDSDKYKDEVLADLSYGSSLGVTGTPTFFINDKMVVGAQPFENIQKVIDEELAKG